MNSFYKQLIAGCMILVQQAAAQQPATPEPAKPKFPELNMKIENALKSAEKQIKDAETKLKDAEIKLKDLKFNEKAFSKFNHDHIKNLKRKFDPEDSKSILQPAAISEKEKQITKTYKVHSKDKLSIQNQFGRVTVNTWSKKEIKVDVVIKAYEASEEEAQRLLDDVSIEESKQGNLVSFKTNINKGKSSGWWDAFKRKVGTDQKRGVEVFYTVYMPSGNPLDITNSYGSIVLPDFDGPINLTSSYSSLTSKNLENKENQLTVKYGSANIQGFSGNINLSYGSLNLNQGDKLNAAISYGSATIDKLTGTCELNIRYTSKFTIREVDKTVDRLEINAAYSGIALGLDKSAQYNYDVTVSFGGFHYNDQLTSPVISPANEAKHFTTTKNYKGTYGSGSDRSLIIVKSNFGSVKFQ